MKRVFGLFEVIFDITYLATALIIGFVLLFIKSPTSITHLAGAMAVILTAGDAFHLVPRILTILTKQEGRYRVLLGRGKQITSITMTIFYLLLWIIGKTVYVSPADWIAETILYALILIRIVLCFLPQNQWTERFPPVKWGVIRNVPFFLVGMTVALRFWIHYSEITAFKWMWLAILLSFGFYLPVVLFANKNPKIGMLMLPKTCMYVWILMMFLCV